MTGYRLSNATILRAIWAPAAAWHSESGPGQIFVLRRLDKVCASLRIGNCLTAQFPALLRNASARIKASAGTLSTSVGKRARGKHSSYINVMK